MKRKGDSKDRDQPEKKARSGQTFSKQLADNVLRGISMDETFWDAPTGLSKEDEAIACEMESDIIEMARDADRKNAPVDKHLI